MFSPSFFLCRLLRRGMAEGSENTYTVGLFTSLRLDMCWNESACSQIDDARKWKILV